MSSFIFDKAIFVKEIQTKFRMHLKVPYDKSRGAKNWTAVYCLFRTLTGDALVGLPALLIPRYFDKSRHPSVSVFIIYVNNRTI